MIEALKRPFPTDFAPEFKPFEPGELGDGDMGRAVDEVIRRLALYGMVGAPNLHEAQAEHVTAIANSKRVREQCYKDRIKRFGDVPMMRTWVGKDGGRQSVGIYELEDWSGEPIKLADLGSITVDMVRQNTKGWAGEAGEEDKHILGADITTAFRSLWTASLLLRERMGSAPRRDRIGLGYAAGVFLLGMLTEEYGAEPDMVSLEYNLSNEDADKLYRGRLGFDEVEGVERIKWARPTQEPIGTVINGQLARLATPEDDEKVQGMVVVDDWRIPMRWEYPEILLAQVA